VVVAAPVVVATPVVVAARVVADTPVVVATLVVLSGTAMPVPGAVTVKTTPADSGPGGCPCSMQRALTVYVLPVTAFVGTPARPRNDPGAREGETCGGGKKAPSRETTVVDAPGPRRRTSAELGTPFVTHPSPYAVISVPAGPLAGMRRVMVAVPLTARTGAAGRTTWAITANVPAAIARIFIDVFIPQSPQCVTRSSL